MRQADVLVHMISDTSFFVIARSDSDEAISK